MVTFISKRISEPPSLTWRTPGTRCAAKGFGSLMFHRGAAMVIHARPAFPAIPAPFLLGCNGPWGRSGRGGCCARVRARAPLAVSSACALATAVLVGIRFLLEQGPRGERVPYFSLFPLASRSDFGRIAVWLANPVQTTAVYWVK